MVAFSLTDEKQTFDWSDTIYIEDIMKNIYDNSKCYTPVYQLLSGDVDVVMSSFRKISQLSDEEEVTLKVMNLSDEEINTIRSNVLQFRNVRLLPLGVIKNVPSPIISYKYKDQTLTSVFIYSDSDGGDIESERINIIRRTVSVFNLIEDMISTQLSEDFKIPIPKDSTTVYLKKYTNISDAKFIFVYYYYLFMILVKFLSRNSILDIIKTRIENPENGDDFIIPDQDILTEILDMVYESSFENLSRNKKISMVHKIYVSCEAYSTIIDNYDELLATADGGNEE